MNINEWSFTNSDGLKIELVDRLKKLELNRSVMLKTLDIASTLSIKQLNDIYNNLSINQKKAKQGEAILVLIEFLKDKQDVV